MFKPQTVHMYIYKYVYILYIYIANDIITNQ